MPGHRLRQTVPHWLVSVTDNYGDQLQLSVKQFLYCTYLRKHCQVLRLSKLRDVGASMNILNLN